MPSTREDIENDEIIYIPERSAQYIFEGKQFAFAAITSVHGDDALVVDGGATMYQYHHSKQIKYQMLY
jgi:hypothetical protein